MPSQYDDRGLLNTRGGETIHLKDDSPQGSLFKEDDLEIARSGSEYSNDQWYVKLWRNDKLMIFIIIAVILGFAVGLLSNPKIQEMQEPSRSTLLVFLGFPGEILMRMLKLLILPLIVSSLIVGLAELDQKASGKLGLRAVVYYMSTTLIAVVLGIVLVIAINPGAKARNRNTGTQDREVRAVDSFMDLIRNMFPDNIVKACIQQLTTKVESLEVDKQNTTVDLLKLSVNETILLKAEHTLMTTIVNGTNLTYYTTSRLVKIAGEGVYGGSTNVLGLVVFSLAIGLILGRMGKKAKYFVRWMTTLNDIVMELVSLVMWYSPIGIWSLIAAKFASMENIGGTFVSLGLYMVTVISGLVIHSFILPTIYLVVTRKNPFLYVKGILQALLTAFGTSSSSATLPVTFRCLEETNKIDKRVTRFVLPIGATINMDGTALYEAVAAIFIAQASGYNLNFGQYIAVSLTATLASIGAAGIPQAGLVTMLIVLQTIGLPEDSITLIIAVDWFLDRIRTTVNVLGDAFGAGIVAHLSREDLREMDMNKLEQERNEPVVNNKNTLPPPHINLYDGLSAL